MSRAGMVTVQSGSVLEPWEYEGLQGYFALVLRKIEAGRAEYGMDYLTRPDANFDEQIDEEVADVTGWEAMLHLKRHQP